MATIAKIFKNKSGFMLALLLIFFIGTAAVMASTLTGDKKEKAPTEGKKKASKAKNMANQYWRYNGGVVTAEGSYTLATGDPCEGSTNLCQIYAPENTANVGHPLIVPGSAFATRISTKNTTSGDVFLED